MSRTLVNINCEMHKHRERIRSFLDATSPHVVCLQEVFVNDLEDMSRRFSLEPHFAPNVLLDPDDGDRPQAVGVGMLLGEGVRFCEQIDYHRADRPLERADRAHGYNWRRSLLVAQVTDSRHRFHIATTHFTWTPDGAADDAQRCTQESLLGALASYSDVVLVGDLNAPRGGEIHTRFLGTFEDRTPPDATTSIDKDLHRAGDLGLIVDHVLSRGNVPIAHTAFQFGVTDHAAVVVHFG